MLTRRGALAVVLLALALAGCAAPASDDANADGPGASPAGEGAAPSTGSTALAPALPPLNGTRTLQLDGCTGWLASITYPGPTSPGERPEGWGPASVDTGVSGVQMQAYRCERISVGAFERPIHLLIEGHTNADFPPKCGENPPDEISMFKVATQVWLDDPEVGAYLRSEYGAPVTMGTFTEADQDLGAAGTHTWTWSADGVGGPPSTMTLTDAKDTGLTNSYYERYFWANGASALVQLDLTPTDHGPQTEMPGNGTLNPPTRFAADMDGAFAGATRWYPERSAAGTFTLYSDRFCEHRVP